ncbi:hypothetical protein [Kribbella soli]|uniref:TrbL/VirB6 plasmid conjugal transfer protein n=1 Tax=Kribbella soli TaxID=1124743 RepID=A0A4R0HDK6_9ACTN|nr:hypothetical protein [Kribbella soli]TCC05799.1 hypothetical protein E0H45_27755 [Kribbella soli]
MRWQRRTRTALTVLAISLIVTSQVALAADPNQGPTNPAGFGDLLPAPDLTHGDTKTLFEEYSPMVYGLDFETSLRDPMQGVFNGYAHMTMMFIVAITRGAIAVGWWLFSFTDIKSLTDTASAAIGNVNMELVGWLLPSALALGAIAAYAQRRASGSAMGQLVWVLVAGVVATSFAMAPKTWLSGVDGARQVGADAVVSTSTDALGGSMSTPIAWPQPSFAGAKKDTLLRKSGDATWRAFAATPWCVAEFGSIAACQRYGKAILDKGTDGDARNSYIDNEISKAEGGGDAATVKWAKGKNPFGRIGVLTLGAIAASLFAFLTIALALTALMAFVGCMMLLVVGVLFACLWAIPGRPRQWAMNWFEALLGLVLQSVLALLVFSTTLALVTAVFGLTDTLGWLPVSGLAIAVLVAGFRLRRLFESMSTMMRPGMGSLMMGGLARRGAMGAVRRVMGALGSRAASPTIGDRATTRERDRQSPAQRVSAVRIFRQAPALGAVGESAGARRSPAHALGATPLQRALASGPEGSARAAANGRSDVHGASGRKSADGATPATLQVASDKKKDRLAGRASGRGVVVASVQQPSSGSASAVRGSSSESKRGRHVRERRPDRPLVTPYESRSRVHSASLRDGPPRMRRDARRVPTTPASRRYRDYTMATKDGARLTSTTPR